MKLTNQQLQELLDLAKKATPRPWHVRHLDDSHAMCLTAISTVPDNDKGERWPEFDCAEIVAATLVQEPRYADIADGRWNENAEFIVAAANSFLSLVEEILELRNSG
jgi:hypothetical protein